MKIFSAILTTTLLFLASCALHEPGGAVLNTPENLEEEVRVQQGEKAALEEVKPEEPKVSEPVVAPIDTISGMGWRVPAMTDTLPTEKQIAGTTAPITPTESDSSATEGDTVRAAAE